MSAATSATEISQPHTQADAPAREPHTQADAPAREVLGADEVAAWFCVDRKTIYNAAARGTIPHQRLGKRILFSRAALVSWLAREGGDRRKDAQNERSTR